MMTAFLHSLLPRSNKICNYKPQVWRECLFCCVKCEMLGLCICEGLGCVNV